MKQKGIFYTILSAVSFGIMPLLCSQAYDLGANAETLVFLRNVFAIMILFVLMKQKHISFAISRKDFKNTALVGIFGITLTALLLYNAYSYISLGTATTLHFLYPAFVALINYVFYKEHLAKSTVLVLLAQVKALIPPCTYFVTESTETDRAEPSSLDTRKET